MLVLMWASDKMCLSLSVCYIRYIFMYSLLKLKIFTQMLKINTMSNNLRASLVAQRLKRLPAMWEMWVQSLGREDPLEKEMATHSSILAWRIPWMEEPGGLQSTGSQRVGHDWATSLTHSQGCTTITTIWKHQFSGAQPSLWSNSHIHTWLLEKP